MIPVILAPGSAPEHHDPNMRFTFITLLFQLLTGPALAGEAEGKVSSILLANNSNAVLFNLDEEIRGSPRCNKQERFAIDLRQVGGNALYRALLEAKSHGYTVYVTGLNTCSVQLESEGVKNIEFR